MTRYVDPLLAQLFGPKISDGATVHESSRVDSGAEIGPEAILEPEVEIGKYVKVVGQVHLARAVKVRELTTLIGPLEVGEGTIIGPGVVIGLSPADIDTRQTRILESCRIGRAVQILASLQVGRHARIRTGSVVHGDVPHYGLAAHDPAVLEAYACPKCGGLLSQVRLVRGAVDAHCEACNAGEYRFAHTFWSDAFSRVLLPGHGMGAPVTGLGPKSPWIDEEEMGACSA